MVRVPTVHTGPLVCGKASLDIFIEAALTSHAWFGEYAIVVDLILRRDTGVLQRDFSGGSDRAKTDTNDSVLSQASPSLRLGVQPKLHIK